ncbi:hypothetical protein VD0002_g1684 [Verticillium dahliae]|uniref:Rhodopsin domain-containing protein n=1 Tax=Verticillium dahliae TaxID=27337 RepID=A0AA44WRX0_VERDA|nr:hypothetical protein BJF96_g2177 [Verticillium dahliae]PNH54786.1 hypothetical protein VD0003_g2724 [Verticillium dahliae]PNH68278.1 hypothetical protein VD0002_g1684 [Verticillium dahliae]
MHLTARKDVEEAHTFVNPWTELNAGLWSLFAGATIFLALRLWVKVTRRHGLWYDDYILLVSWCILLANNALIVHQFATGYVLENSAMEWDDRMHILINISSCGTLIGQALTKTAFAVTLLRMSNQWQKWVLWFCIVTMNLYMVLKVLFQWAKVCDKNGYDNWYRLDFCIYWSFRDKFKEGGNVYNIIMDFVFACFPWLITRSLEMRRVEKIGLSLTMSLGMIVAIVSAIRVSWKDKGNDRDAYYIYRNGLSQVWYSSEITGTIIVQCIPILRPILRDIHATLTSKRLNSSADARSTGVWGSKLETKRASTVIMDADRKDSERMELREIPEEESAEEDWKERHTSSSPSEATSATLVSPRTDAWPLGKTSESGTAGTPGSRSLEAEPDGASNYSSVGYDVEQNGLSAPPRRMYL